MAAAIQTMPQCCSSRPPGKPESPHVCQRTSFRQCRTLFISRRATRRDLTKPLARVLSLCTKARALLLQLSAYGTKQTYRFHLDLACLENVAQSRVSKRLILLSRNQCSACLRTRCFPNASSSAFDAKADA